MRRSIVQEKPKRVWRRPTVRCLEARPEVTAYSGIDGGPWWTDPR